MVPAKVSAVICAAGASTRMNSRISKLLIPLRGRPVIAHTISAFERANLIDEVILVVSRGLVDYYWAEVVEKYEFAKVKKIVEGGNTRQESSYAGVKATEESSEIVAIHDGARPLVAPETIDKLVSMLKDCDGVVVAVPVQDTIKVVGEDGFIVATPQRSLLWAVQTPQVFRRSVILKAHEEALRDNFTATDDAMLVERLGMKVCVLKGEKENLKITTPIDLTLAELIMNER